MLPWYVNGTLNDIEVQATEKHLQTCEACTSELPVLLSLQKSLGKETVAVLAPPPKVEQFLAQLDKPFARRFPSRAAWIAGALAAGVAVVAIALNSFYSSEPVDPVTYRTVTGTDTSASFDYVLHVTLDRQVRPENHAGVLRTLDPTSVTALEAAGNYKVVVRLQAGSIEDLERYRQDFESNPDVSSVSIVAIEMPMETQVDADEK